MGLGSMTMELICGKLDIHVLMKIDPCSGNANVLSILFPGPPHFTILSLMLHCLF